MTDNLALEHVNNEIGNAWRHWVNEDSGHGHPRWVCVADKLACVGVNEAAVWVNAVFVAGYHAAPPAQLILEGDCRGEELILEHIKKLESWPHEFDPMPGNYLMRYCKKCSMIREFVAHTDRLRVYWMLK
jgi:hypothetical protein